MKLIFASSNAHKALEIQHAVPEFIAIQTLADLGYTDDIPETADTLEGNALLKAQFVSEQFGLDCFADDTGLEIEALNGEPGVYSARYAGLARDANDNMDLVLQKLTGQSNRKACFKTVIALLIGEQVCIFEGRVDGIIRESKTGTSGFGYDPIFEPEGTGKTFGEMTLEEKSAYSHRSRAIQKMVDFLAALPEK
jgi:XTP/dITP diphosphohydrolase